MFTSTILKGFVRINLKDTGTDETKPEDRVCSYIDQDVLDAYSSLEASPNQILSLVNASCEGQNEGFFEKMAGFFKRLFSKLILLFDYDVFLNNYYQQKKANRTPLWWKIYKTLAAMLLRYASVR